jgi:WW domain-containing oxidoreductase
MACDLADLASVNAAADNLLKAGRPIDAIITNAGLMGSNQLEKRYGVEMQFLVNHLAHFLLVSRLLPLVPDNTGRIVIVSSSASINQAPKEGILFDNLDGHHSYSAFKFYGQSKLACALYAKELSRRLRGRGIAVNSVHPGAARGTSLNRSLGFPMSAILAFAQLFFKTPEQGAATQCLLAASPLVQGITGEYWSDCQMAKGSRYLNDTVMAQRLWNKSEDILASAAGRRNRFAFQSRALRLDRPSATVPAGGRNEMCREHLMSRDLLSEIVVLGFGALILVTLLPFIVTALTRT